MPEDTPTESQRPAVTLDDEPPDVLGDRADARADTIPDVQPAPAVGAGGGPTPRPLGRVGAPRGAEATSDEFSVWVPDDQIIEKTQLVRVETEAGPIPVRMYGLVSEVSRRSRRVDILEESDRYDNEPTESVPTSPGGVTYARVRVLGSEPALLTPPREEAPVYAGDPADAAAAYGMADMAAPVALGLVRNGGDATAGPAKIDLDYLLGAMGGHCNVTGIAGVGTKSSLLTILLDQTLATLAANTAAGAVAAQARAVILNVKGFDLFWLDHWSAAFTEADAAMWGAMGQPSPRPMDVTYYAPQAPGSDHNAIPTGREGVHPYSWSLVDIVARDLLPYLFGDVERADDNFALLLGDLERVLVEERTAPDGAVTRQLRANAPAGTFRELLDWFEEGVNGDEPDGWHAFARGSHHSGTVRRFHRRLRRIVYESAGIFRLDRDGSHPLDITRLDPGKPAVIDIQSLADPHHQRFVVAALLNQAVDEQTGPQAIARMHYVFVIDELNRFAPRGSSDPITRLVETVAAELRSRGVILLGAQQQASLVSTRVVENASIRILGRTGGHELRAEAASFLPTSLRSFVETMGSGDKVIDIPPFRQPLIARLPRPPWAMRKAEATRQPPAFLGPDAHPTPSPGPRRVQPRYPDDLR
jgi:DNA helicase HerA-like ATPase